MMLLMFLNSCCTQNKCNRLYPPQVRTSNDTTTKYVEHKIIERTPADSSWLKALIECQNGKPVLVNVSSGNSSNGRAPVMSYELKGNDLTIKCKEDSLRKVITTLEKQVQINSSKVEVHETKVNYITSWQWFQIWAGRIFLIALIILLAYIVLKNWIGIKKLIP
jgi:hypothetical protein